MAGAAVFGASGFIGTRLTARLAAQGVSPLRAIDVDPARATLPDVDYVAADVRKPLDPALGEGVGRIYNLAAVHRTPGHPANEYYDTNIWGALNVAALAEATGVAQVLFTSSISVYGPSEALIDEQSPLKPVSDYGRSKAMAEAIHDRWRRAGEGRRLVVVRPGVVFGPGERGNYTHLGRALGRGMFAYPGRRDAIKSGGYVDELLDTFDFALNRAEPGITYNFAFPDRSTTADIVSAFGRVRGKTYSPPTVPLGALMAAATVFEAAAKAGMRTPIHRERVLKLVNSTVIEPGWLKASGYRFTRNLESALQGWAQETGGRFD